MTSETRAVLCDFGLARLLNDPMFKGLESTNFGNHMTIRWASPEVINGGERNRDSDLWAFGWLVWEVRGRRIHRLQSSTHPPQVVTGRMPYPDVAHWYAVTTCILARRFPDLLNEAVPAAFPFISDFMLTCWKNVGERPSPIDFAALLKQHVRSATR